MRAEQIMQQPVLAVTRQASLGDVTAQLVYNGISGMPVVEPDGTVVGVVSESDVLRALVNGIALDQITVEEMMDPDPITVDVETPLADVMRTLHEEAVLRVPVLRDGKLAGIVSRSDLVRNALAQRAESESPFVLFG